MEAEDCSLIDDQGSPTWNNFYLEQDAVRWRESFEDVESSRQDLTGVMEKFEWLWKPLESSLTVQTPMFG